MSNFEELMAAKVVADQEFKEEYPNDNPTDYQEDNFGYNFLLKRTLKYSVGTLVYCIIPLINH